MNRGELWLVCFDPTLGAEIQKTRPAVVLSTNAAGVLPLRVVVPLTGWRQDFAQAPWMVRIDPSPGNGLAKVSAADAFQLKSVSVRRFAKMLGALSASDLLAIVKAVGLVIEHP